jgi:hypothetical protein
VKRRRGGSVLRAGARCPARCSVLSVLSETVETRSRALLCLLLSPRFGAFDRCASLLPVFSWLRHFETSMILVVVQCVDASRHGE